MPINVELVTDSPDEGQVRNRLLGLLRTYDLSRWQFTEQVRVEANAISHSHPILTIRAPMRDDDMLLATYLHEQIHWFTLIPTNRDADRCVERQWRERYPHVPLDPPEGCGSEKSNYLHFTVCCLTHRGIIELVGLERALHVLEQQIALPWYRYINRSVRDDFEYMSTVVEECGLIL